MNETMEHFKMFENDNDDDDNINVIYVRACVYALEYEKNPSCSKGIQSRWQEEMHS